MVRQRQLPPLNGLRSFECAARHGSFLKAASELHVTPGAVSRLIKSLEEYLNVELFKRSHRGVTLTDEGQAYARTVSEAFREIQRATERLQQNHREGTLSICCHPTFAVHWLIPRWVQFQSIFPSAQIDLKTTLAPELEDVDAYDFVVRVGGKPDGDDENEDIKSERVLDVETFPVCSADFLAKQGGRLELSDIPRLPLIHAALRPNDWDRWLVSAGGCSLESKPTLVFESLTLAYNAALSGAGLAIGIRAFVATEIAAGRLVSPFEHVRHSENGFNIYYNARRALKLDKVNRIRDWMLQERARGPDATYRRTR